MQTDYVANDKLTRRQGETGAHFRTAAPPRLSGEVIGWGEKIIDIWPYVCTISCTGGAEMEAITYTAARQNLAKTMEKVCRDRAPMIVTRKSSESVVIMSLEDFEALEETAYLLRSPKNTRRLIESIAQLENGKGNEKELVE
jgi:antitoxin YefM